MNCLTRTAALSAFAVLTTCLSWMPSTASAGEDTTVPKGYDPSMIYLRFHEDVDPDKAMMALVDEKSSLFIVPLKGSYWGNAIGDLDRGLVEDMHAKAEQELGRELPMPWQGVYVQLTDNAEAGEALASARKIPFVEKAIPVPLPRELPAAGGTPDFIPQQGYMGLPQDNGIGAIHTWWHTGAFGEGVEVCDIEYQFDELHCDLPAVTLEAAEWPAFGTDHGTAVLGVLAALHDNEGVSGIAFGADEVHFMPAYTNLVGGDGRVIRRAHDYAVMTAALRLDRGDVILIEQQTAGPNAAEVGQFGLVPVEWFEPTYNAIVVAVANGRIVVEAAGNGSQNLDAPVYAIGNGGHYPFRPENDSGAIIVGAGTSGRQGQARVRLGFSNCGQTVDLQGWGQHVMTTGYGSEVAEANCDYTAGFSGTSSASPIVAGACMLMQSWSMRELNRVLSPADLRAALMATAQPQNFNGANNGVNIGGLPNLPACIALLRGDPDQLYVPWQFDTIQLAVDAAGERATIHVDQGIWAGFDAHGKEIRVVGDLGAEVTIIDGGFNQDCITCTQSTVELEGFTIRNCIGQNGPALSFAGADLVVRACRFEDNFAHLNGGAVWTSALKATFFDCEFTRNAAQFSGGSLYAAGDMVEMHDCIFLDGQADYGGGICSVAGLIEIWDCQFAQCWSRFYGGGLDLYLGTGRIFDTEFIDNTSRRGGAMSLDAETVVSLDGCSIRFNNATNQGGGVWVISENAEFERCEFSRNASANSGGGLWADEKANPSIEDCVFCDNDPNHIEGPFEDQGGNCFADECTDADGDGEPDACGMPGDADGNGVINVDDILIIIGNYGCVNCPGDLNGDGVIDVNDLLIVLNCWWGDC